MLTIINNLGIFWSGFLMTLALVGVSSLAAVLLGAVLATLRVSPVPILRTAATGYVEVVRNVPATVIFFFTLFALPQIDVRMDFFAAAVTALSVYYAAFFCEAIRSGINAVAPGQAEAARSVGMTFNKSLVHVILPQAWRSVIPPLINVFIALVKASAVASAFGVAELLNVMERVINSDASAVIPILLTTAILYLSITITAGIVAGHIERKVAVSR
ncbi:amino acid ABC transporter permease [Arthrobacter sp. BE255]|uniref:amino acid ABC transporter permease n=1 Tax=Arthrobacter sp. BE255 TaxID=2817721 RepID=UPI00285DB258|nr:amino acid ABC transporter permease [Arthrobacter sp. BE255]MDR7159106.1 glutamate transport system permease protein [Arthrobacter sp. BE255]